MKISTVFQKKVELRRSVRVDPKDLQKSVGLLSNVPVVSQ